MTTAPKDRKEARVRDVRLIEAHEYERTPTRQCESAGCRKTTRHNKARCTEHIHEMPYLVSLRGQIPDPAACVCGREIPKGNVAWCSESCRLAHRIRKTRQRRRRAT